MSDIYGDLENYEQENIIEELRNENKELKCKLEQYASTLDTLQKDFDKLSAEYKKLELNYSSLLKTARAEIERKTTIITNLNVEKDKLVISALQNRGKGNHQNKSQNAKNTKQPGKGVGCDKGKNVTSISNETNKTAPRTLSNDRKDTVDKITCFPGTSNTKVKTGSDKTEKGLITKTANSDRDKDKDKTKSKDGKQNHLHKFIDGKGKVEVKKIFNRRKSMPVLKRDDIQFSSDEEQEDNPMGYSERGRFKRKASSRDLNERKYDNDRTGRSSPKVFDTMKFDDKYSSYHDYRKSNSQYSDDRYRVKDNWDRYNTSQRFRRHYSPNRSHYNTRKEHSSDRPHRSDTISHRILESPPPDKYNQYQKSQDVDRHRMYSEETMKHKIHDVVDEPACKRMRTESLNRQSDEHINLQPDRDNGINTARIQPPQFSYLFLQSPDHVHLENNTPFHQVKEIMSTAATDLEDPRLKSNKYLVTTHKDKVTLSTVAGRDVDIKLVNEITWDTNKDKLQKMPTPLREKPQMTEDLIKDIYMDIDHPILNLSLESGEIGCSEDDLRINSINKKINKENTGVANVGAVKASVSNTDAVKATIEDTDVGSIVYTGVPSGGLGNTCAVNTSTVNSGKDILDVANEGVATIAATNLKLDLKCNKPVPNNIQSQHQNQGNKKQIPDPTDIIQQQKSSSLFKKYTIPKINKPNTHKPLEDVITNIMHKLDKKEQCQKDNVEKETIIKEKNTQKEFDIHNPLKLFSSAKQIRKNKTKEHLVDERREKYSPEKVTSSARDTVEGDLELSDETSDCTEFTDQIRYSREKCALASENPNTPVVEITHKETLNCENQSSDNINKQREDLKHGIESVFNNNHANAPVTLPEVKLQGSKTCNEGLKNKNKDMKSKLCDLFGDSSSLITPDDLGIVVAPIASQIVNDYVPLFDNTQDAIDLNVEEMEKVQTRSLKKESDKGVANKEHQDTKHDKKQKHKSSKTNNEGKKKTKSNSEKKTAIETVTRNDNAESLNAEPDVVKTIIISTGVQNNCNSEDLVLDNRKDSHSTDLLAKVDNNVPNCNSLPCLKALATSTPHKISQVEPNLSVPEISCTSNNNLATKDDHSSSNTKNIDTTAQHSSDIPDVRIIIKRRRKGKATAN